VVDPLLTCQLLFTVYFPCTAVAVDLDLETQPPGPTGKFTSLEVEWQKRRREFAPPKPGFGDFCCGNMAQKRFM